MEQNYKEFRELLRRGIGSRSVQAFAQETGLSRGHISRFLNSQLIKQPTWDTIEKLAAGMHTINVDDLLKSCGYDTPYIDTKVEKEEQYLMCKLKDIFKTGIQQCSSLNDFISILNNDCENGKFVNLKIDILSRKEAEKYAEMQYRWEAAGYKGIIPFIIYYSETVSGKVFLVNYSTAVIDLEECAAIKQSYKERCPITKEDIYTFYFCRDYKKEKGVERLLKILDGKDMISTKVGYGFYYPKTAKKFAEFLMDHADTFCKVTENAKLFQKMLEPNANIDEIFAEYAYNYEKGKFAEFLMDHADTFCKVTENAKLFQKMLEPNANIDEIFAEYAYNYEKGTGAAVAYIMQEETGIEFTYNSAYESVEGSVSCIMVEAPNDTDKIPNEILKKIYDYACELEIEEFGICYYQYVITKTDIQWYNINDFHYEYKLTTR